MEIYVDSDTANGGATNDTCAAAALGALDIALDRERPWVEVTGAREGISFFFEGESRCGDYTTADMLRAWDDREWLAGHPRHPLAYLRVYFRNLHRYRDLRHGAQLAAVWRDGRMELLTVDRPNFRPRSEPLPQCPDGIGTVETDDEELSAALCAVGVPLFTARPWRREGARTVYRHHAISPCGRFRYGELALAWEAEDWWARWPDHPFSYLICGNRNCAYLTAQIKQRAPLVIIPHGDLTAMIPADASDALLAKFKKRKIIS